VKAIQYLAKEGLHINQSITNEGLIYRFAKTLAQKDVLKIYGRETYMAFLLQTELKSVVHTFSKQMNNAKAREKFYADDTIHQEPDFDYQNTQIYTYPQPFLTWYEQMQKPSHEILMKDPEKKDRTSFLLYGKSNTGKSMGVYKFF